MSIKMLRTIIILLLPAFIGINLHGQFYKQKLNEYGENGKRSGLWLSYWDDDEKIPIFKTKKAPGIGSFFRFYYNFFRSVPCHYSLEYLISKSKEDGTDKQTDNASHHHTADCSQQNNQHGYINAPSH